MGITETEALALILGGAFLVGSLYQSALVQREKSDLLQLILILGGLAMLAFGLLDVAVDHL